MKPRYIKAAEAHLGSVDPIMAGVVAKVGRCTLRMEPDLFAALVRIIIGQQLAVKAARSIADRVHAAFPRGLTPKALLRADEQRLRACGLSGAKVRAVQAVAATFAHKSFDHTTIHKLPDEKVAERLTAIKGIGPWSVDMALMFALARPDVLPVGDLGIRAAVRELYSFAELPDPATLTRIAEPWRPYRTIACWYLWRSKGPVPQSE